MNTTWPTSPCVIAHDEHATMAHAPANLALIKYMGKASPNTNQALNDSCSITLNADRTWVRVQPASGLHWQPGQIDGYEAPSLSMPQQQRFLDHVDFLCDAMNVSADLVIESANTFPMGCGLASSASSFAALTAAVVSYFTHHHQVQSPSWEHIVAWSRRGSGSACRSWLGPWCHWHADSGAITSVPSAWPSLMHMAVLISTNHKPVGSGEAHRRVLESVQYEGRVQRASTRLASITQALQGDWERLFRLTWQDCWDMHALFACAEQPFLYWEPQTYALLQAVLQQWEREGDGPLVTVDAGPNVHLLFRPEQQDMIKQWRRLLGDQPYRLRATA